MTIGVVFDWLLDIDLCGISVPHWESRVMPYSTIVELGWFRID